MGSRALRLAVLAAALLAGADARADFVLNNTSLPANKIQLTPLPPGANPALYFTATDYNNLAQAANDLRSAVNGTSLLPFTMQWQNTQYTGGALTMTVGNVGTCATQGCAVIGTMKPIDPNGAATWYDTVDGAAFFGSTFDWVRDVGWNLGSNGSRFDGTRPAIGDQWESNYVQDASHLWTERHVVAIGPDGTYQRPWTLQVMAASGMANPIGYTNFGLSADYLWVSGSTYQTAAVNFSFTNPTSSGAGFLSVTNGSTIKLLNNNTQQLLQSNAAANALISLIMADSNNTVQVGDANNSSSMLLNAAGNLTINASSYVQYNAGNSSSLIWGGGLNSSGGTPLIDSPGMYFRSKYFSVTDHAYDMEIVQVMDSTAPTSHLSYRFGGSEKGRMLSTGDLRIPSGTGIGSLTSSGTLSFCATGNDGTCNVGGSSTQAMTLTAGGAGGFTMTQNAGSGTPGNFLNMAPAANTSLSASTELIDVNYATHSSQWVAGTVATQREWRIVAPTYTGASATANFTTAATFAITGAPAAGTNAAITNAYALWVQAGQTEFDGAVNVATTSTVSTGAFQADNNGLRLIQPFRPLRTTVADANLAATSSNTIVGYTSISAARTVTVSSGNGSAGNPFVVIIKDESGSASGTNTITVAGSSGLVDGAASKVCVNAAFGSCRVYCNGTNCFTF